MRFGEYSGVRIHFSFSHGIVSRHLAQRRRCASAILSRPFSVLGSVDIPP